MDPNVETFGSDASLLSLKALYLFSNSRSELSYKKSYELFQKALKIDPANEVSIYHMGLMNMLGFGRE